MNKYNCNIKSKTQVYDGDTIKDVRIEVNIPALEVGFYIIRDIRIAGIDTPERRPKKAGRTPQSIINEKQAANEARDFLIGLLKKNNFQFTISELGYGKYAGRIIADLYINDELVSDLMINAGYAKPYSGGKRPSWNF